MAAVGSETTTQFVARCLLRALGVGTYEPLTDEDLSRLAAMAEGGPSPQEQAAAEAAGEEPGLATRSAADYRREATPDDADAQGGGSF